MFNFNLGWMSYPAAQIYRTEFLIMNINYTKRDR